MKRLVSLGTSILVLCGTLLFHAVALADPAADVKAAYVAWDAAFSARDAKRVAAFYTNDAVFVPQSHAIIKGSAAVEDFVQGLFDIGITSHKLEVIEVVTSNAQTIVVLGKWSARLKDGTADDGIVAQVFQRQPDGSLKIKLQVVN
jgi:ketosteroid isomerase-like protein